MKRARGGVGVRSSRGWMSESRYIYPLTTSNQDATPSSIDQKVEENCQDRRRCEKYGLRLLNRATDREVKLTNLPPSPARATMS